VPDAYFQISHAITKVINKRAILVAKNMIVNVININIQHVLPDETAIYKSIDTVMNQDEAVNYPTKFLNSLDLIRLPPSIIYS